MRQRHTNPRPARFTMSLPPIFGALPPITKTQRGITPIHGHVNPKLS